MEIIISILVAAVLFKFIVAVLLKFIIVLFEVLAAVRSVFIRRNKNNDNIINRQKVYDKLEEFINDGDIKEVYKGDIFAVFNVADYGYFLVDYAYSSKDGVIPIAIFFKKEILEKYISDSDEFFNFFTTKHNIEYFKRYSVYLTKDLINDLKNIVKKYKLEHNCDTNRWIDLEWEEKIRSEHADV